VRPPRACARPAEGPPARQKVRPLRNYRESVNDTLKGQLGLERHGGRTTDGVCTRTAQRLPAMAVCIWHNRATGEPVKPR